ncbi:DUF6443 domain-containing protein [Zunongwangia pacifica]|uniref:DUF6443 domain-containing protein n=1 Tax=Zunongwangia pacifica TaxID=2911062 RepID=A0A9X2A153_9FLAO|nr:DUF6443 domain-containing protein [Zunongwangia pacifica]MCL6220151.1 DUF6443 domain-containing protein [Zunongwangia pacifica]
MKTKILLWGISLLVYMFVNQSFGQVVEKDSVSASEAVIQIQSAQAVQPPPGGGGGGTTYPWNRDRDNDGYGDPNDQVMSETKPAGYVANASDCNDNDSSIHPGATEIADGKDNDCDGLIDEGVPSALSNEDFENNLGDWQQATNDDIDWTRLSGSTPSSNTGPASAISGSYYLYLEATSNTSKRGIISSPFYTIPQGYEMRFNYHMYGADMGSLTVEISSNGTSWALLWSKSGDQGNAWREAIIDLSSYGGNTRYIRFNGLTGSNYRSDIAIDNIVFASATSGGGAVDFSDENYVYTRTYRQAHTTSLDQSQLTPSKATESITYFDGLGRPMQQIGIKQGGAGYNDIISHIGYDASGRQDKDYLPYIEDAGESGAYRGDVRSETKQYYKTNFAPDFSASTSYSDANPYSEKVYEPSPLNRIIEQGAPGDDWKIGSGNTVRTDYASNETNEVRLYRVTLSSSYVPSLSTPGYYSAGALYKTVVKDENWSSGNLHTTEEFKDKQGRVVLRRTYGPADKNMDGDATDSGESEAVHDTYYIYDDYGNLSYVLPPKSEATVNQPSSGELAGLCYQYRYDKRNRLIEKRLPGKDVEYMVYNNLDQLAMSQASDMRSENSGKEKDEWLFTKYDAFGRIVYTGKIDNDGERSSMEGIFSGAAYHYEKRQGATNVGGKTIYYSNQAKPSGINELYTVNYYDNYDYNPSLSLPSSSQGQTIVQGGSKVQGLATGSLTRVLNTNHWIEVINGYDAKGRLIYTKEQNPYLGTTQTTEHLLDAFTGEVEKTKTTHVKTGTGAITITVEDFYQYDDLGRMTLHTQKVNGGNEERIAANTYDELGQLKSKEVGNRKGYTALQEVDYAYNVRGWLKGINNIGSTSKLFNMSLYYHDGNSTDLYNGNISEVRWRTKNTDNAQKSYKYYYDALNRITKAYGGTGSGDNGDKFNLGSSSIPTTYDLNGNITHLFRRGAIVASPSLSNNNHFGSMDNLIYKYQGTSNKLQRIEENSGNDNYGFLDHSTATTEYTYDLNGNLKTDANKDITSITYNHLNLPTSIIFNGSSSQKIEYFYDANGVKLKKRVNDNGSITETLYAGNFMYRGGSFDFYFHPEGYVSKENGSYKYVYQYKDHLGNIRVSYDNSGSVSSPNASIVEEHNYYPFGLQHKGYNNVVNGTEHPYKYNGKELEEELGLGWYDYQARRYDPALGRWHVVDPAADLMRRHSPYNYAFDNPIRYIDPDGMLPEDIIIRGENGSSLTIVTDLIDVDVNAGGIVGDLGGNYSFDGEDILVAGLDIVGIVDPSGVADVAAASIEAKNGNYGSAILSGLGVVPYLGDVGKVGKIPKHLKTINKAVDAVKAEKRAAKLSKVGREGKNFTKAGKEAVIDVNKAKNNGKVICENCGTNTLPATQSKKGVTPSKKERQVDHIDPKSKGGSGTPDNGQVLCRDCNIKKSNN